MSFISLSSKTSNTMPLQSYFIVFFVKNRKTHALSSDLAKTREVQPFFIMGQNINFYLFYFIPVFILLDLLESDGGANT